MVYGGCGIGNWDADADGIQGDGDFEWGYQIQKCIKFNYSSKVEDI